MRKRRMVWEAFGVALLSLALSGAMAAGAAAQSGGTPWLGVTTLDITSELREGLDYQGSGVIVNRVVPDSPADRAGIRKGDVITSVNSRNIDSAEELVEVVRASRVGQAVAVSVVRNGARRSLTARLGEMPEDFDEYMEPPSPDYSRPDTPRAPRAPRAPIAPKAPSSPKAYTFEWNGDDIELPDSEGMMMLRSMGRGRLGVQIQELDVDLGEALGVPDGKGVLVVGVVDGTPAKRAGIKAGDVIARVGDTMVENVADLHEALRDKEGQVTVTVLRRGTRRTVQAELEAVRDVKRKVIRIPGNGGSALMRIPEIRSRVLRDRARSLRDRSVTEDDGDMEKEMQELRQELREMRRKLEAMDRK